MPSHDLTMLEHTLLALAVQEPRSGYDLRKLFETTGMQQFSSSPGSIYPALRRLEKRGFLASAERSNGDRTRRLYRATAAGLRVTKAWVLAPATLDELRRDGRLPILRFAFLGAVGADRAATRAFLASYRDALVPYLAELRDLAEAMGQLPDPRLRLAIQHGIEQVKAQQRWIDQAQRSLGGKAKTQISRRRR